MKAILFLTAMMLSFSANAADMLIHQDPSIQFNPDCPASIPLSQYAQQRVDACSELSNVATDPNAFATGYQVSPYVGEFCKGVPASIAWKNVIRKLDNSWTKIIAYHYDIGEKPTVSSVTRGVIAKLEPNLMCIFVLSGGNQTEQDAVTQYWNGPAQ
jgi:hypothetical protein